MVRMVAVSLASPSTQTDDDWHRLSFAHRTLRDMLHQYRRCHCRTMQYPHLYLLSFLAGQQVVTS